MVKGSFSFNQFFKEDYEVERPSKNYPQKLTIQRQKSFESHLSSTLLRVKLLLAAKTALQVRKLDTKLGYHNII